MSGGLKPRQPPPQTLWLHVDRVSIVCRSCGCHLSIACWSQAIAHMQPIASYLALTPAQAAPGAAGSGSVAAAMSALLGSLSAGLHESVVPGETPEGRCRCFQLPPWQLSLRQRLLLE